MRFRLRPGRSWGDLVTAVVVRDDGTWSISSWIDAPLEAGGDFGTLDQLVQVADALVRDSYPPGPGRAGAELQYAIYPWSFKGRPQAMLDVTENPEHLSATDISGSASEVIGKTAEDLVEEAGRLAQHPQVMLRWVKAVGNLTDAGMIRPALWLARATRRERAR